MFFGLRTAVYPVPDLAQGKAWYQMILEREPYFDEPYYVGFNVGGFELGLIPDGEPGSAGVVVYWGVGDVNVEMLRLESLGAIVHEPVVEVGGAIKVGSIRDPWGNVIGVIENPHFDRRAVE
jgi:predicted enzyme related to lactoylglutathione lyase